MNTTWNTENTANLTAEKIAVLLPSSWTFSFVDIAAALNFHRPGGPAAYARCNDCGGRGGHAHYCPTGGDIAYRAK